MDYIDENSEEENKHIISKFMDESETSEESLGDERHDIIITYERMPLDLSKFFVCSLYRYDFVPFQHGSIILTDSLFNEKWLGFFNSPDVKKNLTCIEQYLNNKINLGNTILPYPALVFNTFNLLAPEKIKVVIIGQDPYFNICNINGKDVPQAMGLSFSVPCGISPPPSLVNIFKNLIKFKHIQNMPTSGNLSSWVLQGCLMINTALTTVHKAPNAHSSVWKGFTKNLVKYINDRFNNIVFIAWGNNAHNVCLDVDPKKHKIITSSHPSPYSSAKEFTGQSYGLNASRRTKVMYPPFESVDHFGEANKFLLSKGKSKILYDSVL